MRVVATGAVHFSLAHGMMRKPQLGFDLLFVAGIAGILDRYVDELMAGGRARSRMDRVAGGAGDALDVVRTARPEQPVPFLMAFETGFVAH